MIRLTQGSLKNSYVLLAKHLEKHPDFFPPDALGPANAQDGEGTLLTLVFDGPPGTKETDIAGKHKIFRRRSHWQTFFDHHRDLAEGDSVVIERQSTYEYHVSAEHAARQDPDPASPAGT